jgi:hypothetical protein
MTEQGLRSRGLRLGPAAHVCGVRMAADDGITPTGSPTTTTRSRADPLKRADATRATSSLALAQYFLVAGAGTS